MKLGRVKRNRVSTHRNTFSKFPLKNWATSATSTRARRVIYTAVSPGLALICSRRVGRPGRGAGFLCFRMSQALRVTGQGQQLRRQAQVFPRILGQPGQLIRAQGPLDPGG